jgi:hypothetical protein
MSRPYVRFPDFRTLDAAEATLGEIDRVLKAEGKRTANPAQLWALSDEKFSWRADYRIWRTLFRAESPSRISKAWQPSEMVSLAESELFNQNGRSTVNTWSILMMTSGIVTRREGQIFSFNSLDRLVNAADYAMANGLAPLRGYLKSCALIRALTADAVQKFRFRYYEPMSVAHARQYVADLIAQLKVASPGWMPGQGLRLEFDAATMFPFSSVAMCYRVTRLLYSVHFVVDAALRNVPNHEYDPKLTHNAAQMAQSGWKLVRAMRIGFERQSSSSPYQGWPLEEMRALRATCAALRNAGNDLGAANLCYYLLRVLPDDLVNSKEFNGLGTSVARAIREAGLEVDSRFLRSRQSEPPNATATCVKNGNGTADPLEAPGGKELADNREPSPASQPQEPDPLDQEVLCPDRDQIFVHRLIVDQRSEDWKTVLAAVDPNSSFALNPGLGLPLLQKVVRCASSGQEYSEEMLGCAFRLLLRYGKIHSASKLLVRFGPSENDIFRFLSYVRQELRLVPFALDREKHEEWLAKIRGTLNAFRIEHSWTDNQRLLLHEALLGSGISIMRSAGNDGMRALTRKFYGQLEESEIRTLTDDSDLAFRRGPGALGAHRIKKWILTQRRPPIFISVISFGNPRDQFHIMALLPTGYWRQRVVTIPGVFQAVQQVCGGFSLLRSLGDLPWPQPLRDFAREIIDLVSDFLTGSPALLLAVEPALAEVPWQNLLMRYRNDLVVSMVPNLSWVLSSHRQPQSWLSSRLFLSNAPDLAKLQSEIHASWPVPATKVLSTAVVVGHGRTAAAGTIPDVYATPGKNPLRFEEWLEIAQRRVTVVHSCFGSSHGTAFLGNFGGLPALALGLGCRLFCAPVAEVPPNAASVFQNLLSKARTGKEIGDLYLNAIQQDNAVSFYNLYGLPSEPFYASPRQTKRPRALNNLDP